MSAAPSSEHTGFFRRLRQLLAHALELACVRLDLLALETRQEASRLLAVLLCALAANTFICFELVFLAVQDLPVGVVQGQGLLLPPH